MLVSVSGTRGAWLSRSVAGSVGCVRGVGDLWFLVPLAVLLGLSLIESSSTLMAAIKATQVVCAHANRWCYDCFVEPLYHAVLYHSHGAARIGHAPSPMPPRA